MQDQTPLDAELTKEANSPAYQLHVARSIHLAAILGSALAAGILMYINSKRLGEDSRASVHVIVGLGITVGFVLLAAAIPAEVPGLVITLLQAAAVAFYFNKQQEDLVNEKVAQGARPASRWIAVGVSLLIGAVLLGLVILLFGWAAFADPNQVN